MNKRVAAVFISVLLGLSVLSVTALADPVEENGQITGVIDQSEGETALNEVAGSENQAETPPAETQSAEAEAQENDTGEAENSTDQSPDAASPSQALTPDGNLTLIDDYGNANGEGKQFIILATRSGNIFYLIIDRDDEGNETVHFLNQVDEADLFALMDEADATVLQEEIAAAEAAREAEETAARSEQNTSEQEDTSQTEPQQVDQQPERSGANPVLLSLPLILVFGGVVGYLIWKAKKGKAASSGSDSDAGYQDEEDPDIYDLPEETYEVQDPASEDDLEPWQNEEE